MNLQYYVRKARYEDESDVKTFKDFFLKEAERYEDTYYTNHINWLENKAFPEIKKGISRFAFGAFYSTPFDHKPVLLGGIIIKKPAHTEDPLIELKTITVADDKIWKRVLRQGRGSISESDLQGEIEEEQKNIRILLLKLVERYASKRGIQKLEVEVPEGNHMLLQVLLRNHFRFIDSQESRYMKGSVIYSFEKELHLRYCQDPFDFVKMSVWFMERQLGFVKVDSLNTSEVRLEKRTFLWDPMNKNEVDDQIEKENIHAISCICYIFPSELSESDEEKILQSLEDESFHLTYFFSFHENLFLQKISQEKGIKCYFYNDIKELLFPKEDPDADIPLIGFPFDKKDIRGLLIVEDKRFSKRIQAVSSKFKYLLLNGIGKFLDPQTYSSGEELFVAFYSPHSDQHGIKGEVWGVSKIIGFQEMDYMSCVEEFKNLSAPSPIFLFEEEEFKERFMGRWGGSTSKEIIVLSLEPAKLLSSPLKLGDFVSDNVLKITDSDWKNGGLMKMYLDQKTVTSLREFPFGKLSDSHDSDDPEDMVNDINIILQHIEQGKTEGDTVQNYVYRIKALVERNEIRVAFFLAKKIFKILNKDSYNKVIVLENQWNSTEEELDLSLITHKEGMLQKSKTIRGFLHLIDKI
ncbi:MAG: hypothetical protein AAF587_12700 [Bacteroidota bacterium]